MTTHPNESALIAAAKGGCEKSFNQLIERSRLVALDAIYSLVKRKCLVDEIFQDAVLSAWVALGNFRGESRFSTWFYTIAHNEAAMAVRKPSYRLEVSLDTEEGLCTLEHPVECSAEEVVSQRQQFELLVEACESLPEKHRATIEQRAIDGVKYKEIAQNHQVTKATVRSWMRRGRAAIADKVGYPLSEGKLREV